MFYLLQVDYIPIFLKTCDLRQTHGMRRGKAGRLAAASQAPRAGENKFGDFGLRVWGLGLRVCGLGLSVWDLGLGFRACCCVPLQPIYRRLGILEAGIYLKWRFPRWGYLLGCYQGTYFKLP